MSDLRKAAEMALEALNYHFDNEDDYLNWRYPLVLEAKQALRQALAHPEPYKGISEYTYQTTNGRLQIDPVTGDAGIGTPPNELSLAQPEQWKTCRHCGFDYKPPKADKWFPLEQTEQEPVIKNMTLACPSYLHGYTAPPWVGLTDEEIYDYADKFLYQHGSNYGIRSFGKAIEAKLKEKNT
jgi:hypothetical protein